MEAVKRGGLSGKARKVHYRSRAARLYAQQLIDEYIEPVPQPRDRHRSIPIRGRGEFLASVAQTWHAPAASRNTQLELPRRAHPLPARREVSREPDPQAAGAIQEENTLHRGRVSAWLRDG